MELKTCNRCVMNNTSDRTIYFDSDGICNYCQSALQRKELVYFPNKEGESKLNNLISEVKDNRKNSEFDCLMGISGGLDSSYLAYLAANKWGLKIKAIHVDDGFDTKTAKQNIEKIIETTGIDYTVINPDFESFRKVIIAYMNAGVPNLAAPQDNLLFAEINKFAKSHKIKYFLSGGNFSLENILQQDYTYDSGDTVNIFDIYKKNSNENKIENLKFISKSQRYIDQKIFRVKNIRPLNYINYNKNAAISEMKNAIDYNYYEAKHLENDFTAFLQLIWLPEKFNVDKRTSHLSSLIISDQLTREDALIMLKEPICTADKRSEIIHSISTKLKLSVENIEQLIKAPGASHLEYKTDNLYKVMKKVLK